VIAWPLAAAVPPRAGADLSLHEERRRTILLIEDDVAIANMYRFQLASDGFRVIQAFDGVQGLNAVFERRPDLVLLDVRLPGMEGFAVLERIRSEPALAATPVVILSNFSFGPKDVMVVFSAGGTTAVPVEMARGARRRGIRVIAVTSVEQSMSSAVDPAVGSRLLDENRRRFGDCARADRAPRGIARLKQLPQRAGKLDDCETAEGRGLQPQ